MLASYGAGAKCHRAGTFRSVAHDIAAGRSSSFAAWATEDASLAEDSPSPLMTPELAGEAESCEQESTVPGQPAVYQSIAHAIAAGRSSSATAWAAGDSNPAQHSASQLTTPKSAESLKLCQQDCPELRQHGACRSVAQDIAAGRSTSFAAWAASAANPAQHSSSRLTFSKTPESAAPLESCQQDSSAARQPAGSHPEVHASGSMSDPAPIPDRGSTAGNLRMPEDSARGCEASCMSLGAVQTSAIGDGMQSVSLGEQSLPMNSPRSMQSGSPGGGDNMPCPPAQHQNSDVATGARTGAAMGSPAQQSLGVAGNEQQSYDPLLAARQVFGVAQECYSPALAHRGWDGSARMAFTAWQHVTVMLWQRRLQTAAPLIRRRRFR